MSNEGAREGFYFGVFRYEKNENSLYVSFKRYTTQVDIHIKSFFKLKEVQHWQMSSGMK